MIGWMKSLLTREGVASRAVALADDAVRATGRWIDELQLTEEERVKMRLQTLAKIDEYVGKALAESSAQAVTRRAMAWAIIAVFLLLVLTGAIAWWWVPQYPDFLIRWIDTTGLDTLVTGVGMVYFAGHYARDMIGNKKGV